MEAGTHLFLFYFQYPALPTAGTESMGNRPFTYVSQFDLVRISTVYFHPWKHELQRSIRLSGHWNHDDTVFPVL